jgi:arabinofuranan 3-O-arabinosyltransferase
VLNPFPNAGTDGETVSVTRGARYVYAPAEPGVLQFPEHTAAAAFDGDVGTSWIADRNLPAADRWIEVAFNAPRNVSHVDLYPLSDRHGVVTEIDINGIHHTVHPGWTRIPVHLHAVRTLRVTIDHVVQPKIGLSGAGGFKEIRIQGLHVSELLRPPVLIGRELAGADLRHDGLSYVFERTTGDDPFRRQPFSGTTVLDDPKVRGDAEAQIDRIVFAPVARTYTPSAWVYPAVGTTASTLDRLAGYTGPESFDSSARFQDQPAYRASSAFATTGGPGWIGVWQRPSSPPPWISWTTPRATTVSRLTLAPSSLVVRRPTVVSLSWPGGATPPLTVAADGSVTLPRAVRARRLRLTILQASFPAGATQRQRASAAVGIGSVEVPGMARPQIPTAGPLHAACGSVSVEVAGRQVALRPHGTVAGLNAGRPFPATACGPERGVAMAGGVQEIRSLPGPFSVDLLRLSSPAPQPVPSAATGVVADPGRIGSSSVSGVRVALTNPSWLVLGESYDSGWRATCDGRSLGAPQVIDGYANGWLAPASCRRVAFAFGPQAGVRTSYVISAVVCAVLLLFLIVGALRRPALASGRILPMRIADPPTTPRPLPQALALALALSVAIGYIFAIRAGVVSVPLLTFVLWRGYGPRTLAIVAAALFAIVIPVTYALTQPRDRYGDSFAYATDLIAAHWMGVTVLVLCTMIVWMIVAATRRARATRTEPHAPNTEGSRTGPTRSRRSAPHASAPPEPAA